jgi:serine/threonine protein kinase
LTEAHESGIIHRDIKPRNILLCRLGASFDVVKVLDFALPRVLHDSSQAVSEIAKEGEVFGKPAFMAPELVTGEGVADQSSDIYALGCVAYWLLSGETVSQARSVVAMALAHVREDPQPVSLRAEFDIPPALDDLILACLDRDCARTGVCPGGDGSASCPPIGSPLDAGAGRAMVAREPSASSAGCRQRSSVASGLAGRRRSKTPLVAGACRGKPSHRCGKWSNPAAGKMWSSQV